MVAMPTLDLIVSIVWVGALAVVLLAQAVYLWLGHRHWARYARYAARLADATRPAARPAARATPDLKLLPGGLEAPAAKDQRDKGTGMPAEA